MKHFKKALELGFFTLGIALFVWVIHSVEPGRLKIIMPALAGWGWLVFAVFPATFCLNVQAWKYTFAHVWEAKLPFRDLYTLRLASEAVNGITPVADVGGEPLKVIIASRRFEIPKSITFASVVIDRTALFTAQTLFCVLGLGLSFFMLPLPREWTAVFLLTVFLSSVFIIFFITAQRKGLFTTFIQWLDFFQLDPERFKRFHISFQKADEEIASFYAEAKNTFGLAIGLHTLAWILGSLETYVMFHILQSPLSLAQAMMIESLFQLVRTATFFIPASLGSQEGGLAFFAQLLGYHPAIGVAASLLKRMRQILWMAIGFAIWGVYQLVHLKGNQV
ncbi:MAG: flippase-like domain-containing protein [Candidatus Omnitrophota bacterium]